MELLFRWRKYAKTVAESRANKKYPHGNFSDNVLAVELLFRWRKYAKTVAESRANKKYYHGNFSDNVFAVELFLFAGICRFAIISTVPILLL